MAEINSLVADANKQIESINKGGKIQLPKLTPLDAPISSSTLRSQPEFNLQNTQVSTQKGDAFGRDLRSEAEYITKNRDFLTERVTADRANAEQAKDTSQFDLLTSILEAPTLSEIQSQQYQKFGVDERQLEVDKLSTKLIQEQDALRTASERILSDGGGLKMGAQSEIANLERESYAKQADIALLQLAAQDQLDYATRVADRAVNAMFERQEKIEQVRRTIYEENKELFNKAEQREFELMLSDRTQAIEEQKFQTRLTQSTKIDALKMAQLNGAPQSILNAIATATTPEEVIDVAGQYGSVDMLDRALKAASLSKAQLEYDKLLKELSGENDSVLDPETREKVSKSPEARRASSKINLLKSLNQLKGMVQEYGAKPLNREHAASLASARAALQFSISQAFEQGAIQAGDRDQYEQLLGAGLFDTSGKTIARIDTFASDLQQSTMSDLDYVEATYPGAKVAFEPFAEYLNDVEVQKYLDEQLQGVEGVVSNSDPYAAWLQSIGMYDSSK